MKLDLQVRDLKTGERAPKSFESVEEAKKWLADRPKYAEVLGVASHHIPPEVNDELRAAMRPLDAEEKILEQQLAATERADIEKRAEERRKKEQAEADKHRADMKNADPNRPLEIRYVYNRGVQAVDPEDTRAISDEVKAAIKAWVDERNEWVESRNQVVGDARITVWPGPIPAGKTERIITGSFVPVTAPAKPKPN
jgi:flagellar motility protein MotE (MotC chaperone)